MILPASMAAGWLLGYFVVDRFLSSFPWGSIVFILFGAGTGFFEIVRILIPARGKGDRSTDGKG
jgi:F0F1-type ATP synthase assembly protein I